jgi:hypothetical protein
MLRHMFKVAVLFCLLLSASLLAAPMDDADPVSAMGTKSKLTTKIVIQVPADSQPAFIQLNPKTGKRELVAKLDLFKPHCTIHLTQSSGTDELSAETILYPRSLLTSVDDHYHWGELHMILSYSLPATDLVCQGEEGRGALTVGALRTLVSPFFELDADTDAR